MEIYLFKNIYKNYLENLYLYVYSIVKDEQIALSIVYTSFDKVFTYDFYFDNLLNLHEKIEKYILKEIKRCLGDNYLENISKDNNLKIPERLYDLDINTYSVFDYIDNQIITYAIVFGKLLPEISSLLNIQEDYIYERFKNIIRFIRTNYLKNIKQIEV